MEHQPSRAPSVGTDGALPSSPGASDAQGLSYYSDSRIAELLGLEPAVLRSCRRELMDLELIAYQKPLYQLLSLESGPQERSDLPESVSQLQPDMAAEARRLSLKAMVEKLVEQKRSRL